MPNIYLYGNKSKVNMATKTEVELTQFSGDVEHALSWDHDPSVRKLLDVISYILANEYVNAIRENPSLFSQGEDHL